MDSNMNQFLKNIESENSILHEQVNSLDSEVFCLKQQVSELEKALEKQKKFHRKFAEEVDATERLRTQDFKEERSVLNNRIKLLVNEKRQLSIDCTFYKKSYEELIKEKESNVRAVARTKSPAAVSERSSKVLSQLSEKMLAENKKLKVKVEDLNKTIRILKSKNLKMENFKKKMENKKSKNLQDSQELGRLVKSTETNNGIVFNPVVLAKLGQLSTI